MISFDWTESESSGGADVERSRGAARPGRQVLEGRARRARDAASMGRRPGSHSAAGTGYVSRLRRGYVDAPRPAVASRALGVDEHPLVSFVMLGQEHEETPEAGG